MRLSVSHDIRIAVPDGIPHAVQHLLLTPQDVDGQTVVEWSVTMPGMDGAAAFTDGFGNLAHLVSQTRPEPELTISVRGIVETTDTHGVIGRPAGDRVPALFKRVTALTRPNGHLVNRLRAQERSGLDRIALLHWLMARLHEGADAARAEGEDGDPDIVPVDHAHVFVAAARGMDIPARIVTGYCLRPEGEGAQRLHYWAEAWDEKLGWIGFDPSANLCPTDRYVRLACGLDAETARPVRVVPPLAVAATETVSVAETVMASQHQQQQQS